MVSVVKYIHIEIYDLFYLLCVWKLGIEGVIILWYMRSGIYNHQNANDTYV